MLRIWIEEATHARIIGIASHSTFVKTSPRSLIALLFAAITRHRDDGPYLSIQTAGLKHPFNQPNASGQPRWQTTILRRPFRTDWSREARGHSGRNVLPTEVMQPGS